MEVNFLNTRGEEEVYCSVHGNFFIFKFMKMKYNESITFEFLNDDSTDIFVWWHIFRSEFKYNQCKSICGMEY